MGTDPIEPFPYVLTWDREGRQGQRCMILGGKKHFLMVQVRFEDGYTAIVNRKALRRKPAS